MLLFPHINVEIVYLLIRLVQGSWSRVTSRQQFPPSFFDLSCTSFMGLHIEQRSPWAGSTCIGRSSQDRDSSRSVQAVFMSTFRTLPLGSPQESSIPEERHGEACIVAWETRHTQESPAAGSIIVDMYICACCGLVPSLVVST